MNFIGQPDCGMSIKFVHQQTWNPLLAGLMSYIFFLKKLYYWCWFGRIRACRGKMLQTNSTEWLLWRIRTIGRYNNGRKGFTVPSHSWRGSDVVRHYAWRNRENLSDLHQEGTIIYFLLVLYVFVISIPSYLAINRNEGQILGFTRVSIFICKSW